jgi:hypothetical protein
MLPIDDIGGASSAPENTATASPDTGASASPSPDTAGSQAPASPATGETTAPSPDAPTDDRSALLAIVKKVVETGPKNPSGEGKQPAASELNPATVTNTETQAAAEAAALEADPTEAEMQGLAPRTKARMEKLLSQRHAARQELEAAKPLVAKWTQMEGYLTKHNLAPSDANMLLGIGANLRSGNFKAFLDGVMPYVTHAQEALGLAIPNDLRAKVETGELSEDAAKQLTVTRIQNARLQTELKANGDAQAAQREAEAQARNVGTITTAMSAWEQNVRTRDPDYARIAPEVEAEARLLIAANGTVKSVEEATSIAERAYARVKRLYAAGRPAPAATPKQPSGARAVNGARPEPKNLMEAAMQGLERARA